MEHSQSWYEPDPTPPPDYICDKCGEECYGTDSMWNVDGLWLCSDCALKELIKNNPADEILDPFFISKQAQHLH